MLLLSAHSRTCHWQHYASGMWLAHILRALVARRAPCFQLCGAVPAPGHRASVVAGGVSFSPGKNCARGRKGCLTFLASALQQGRQPGRLSGHVWWCRQGESICRALMPILPLQSAPTRCTISEPAGCPRWPQYGARPQTPHRRSM